MHVPLHEWQRLEREDPEMYGLLAADMQLERQSGALAEAFRRAAPDDRAKIKTELTSIVNKHFDVRQKRRELQMKRLETELQRLREAIAKRNESREAIVAERISQLAGETKDLEF
jgi:hypothetical protein